LRFWGIRLEPDANESDTRQNPNSEVDQSTISPPSCDRCPAQVAAALT
jgi:hypothetical protein